MTDLTTDALKRLAARLQLESPHVGDWEDEDGDPVPFAYDIRAAVSAIHELIERREADAIAMSPDQARALAAGLVVAANDAEGGAA